MCVAVNGGKMPEADFIKYINMIPPTDYQTLMLMLKHEGIRYNIESEMKLLPYSKKVNRLSVSDKEDIGWIEKLCGKKFKATKMPNQQEIFITLK